MICDKCLHANVCGAEGAFEEGLTYCRDFLGWIPVSERLPEKNMPCLVSVGIFHITKIAVYSDLLKTIEHKIFYTGDYGYADFADITEYVLAWMPLPDPYKPQATDKDAETQATEFLAEARACAESEVTNDTETHRIWHRRECI